MTSTFLHQDQSVPPDEAEERDAPPCPTCGELMWIIRVETELSDQGARSKRSYECTRCGTRKVMQTVSEFTPF